MTADDEQYVGFAERFASAHLKSFIFLFVDQSVGAGGPDHVTVESVRPFRNRILDGVEEGLVVISPGNGIDALRVVHERFPGAQILDGKRVLAEPSVIGRISQQISVVADVVCTKGHELLAFGEFIHVD
jgi:hypothetical protein